jgi:DNA polymerase V
MKLEFVLVPADAGVTGFESPAADYAKHELLLDEVLIERKSSTFLARASGNSMQGFGIYDKDLLIVDRAAPPSDLDVVVAVLNGQLVCKMLHRSKGLLLSGNPQYPPVSVTEFDDFVVEGIVIRSVRLLREPALLAGELT